MAQRHPDLILSFPLCRSTRVPQRRPFLWLLHKFTASSRTTTWHGIAWWDKQHFLHRSHIVFQVVLFSAVDNWAPFVLPSAERPYLSPIASDLVIWRWDVLWKPEAGIQQLCKGIPLFFYVTSLCPFIMSLQDSADTLLWRVKSQWVNVHLRELQKRLLLPREM